MPNKSSGKKTSSTKSVVFSAAQVCQAPLFLNKNAWNFRWTESLLVETLFMKALAWIQVGKNLDFHVPILPLNLRFSNQEQRKTTSTNSL